MGIAGVGSEKLYSCRGVFVLHIHYSGLFLHLASNTWPDLLKMVAREVLKNPHIFRTSATFITVGNGCNYLSNYITTLIVIAERAKHTKATDQTYLELWIRRYIWYFLKRRSLLNWCKPRQHENMLLAKHVSLLDLCKTKLRSIWKHYVRSIIIII